MDSRFKTVDLSRAIAITDGDPFVVASPAILAQDAEELRAAFERAFTGPRRGLYGHANVKPSGTIERDAELPGRPTFLDLYACPVIDAAAYLPLVLVLTFGGYCIYCLCRMLGS
jgi:hypothetical protein